MGKELKFPEKFLYEIWKERNFNNELSTTKGDKIKIIDCGSQNSDLAGPDFKSARIKIGNVTYQGDIEIDSFYSDWKAHGHYLNKKYNKVILHFYFTTDGNKPFVYTQEGRKIPSISMGKFLNKDLKTTIQKAIVSERQNRTFKMPCSEINNLVSEETKLSFLYELGLERFKKKRNKMLRRLKEIIYLDEMQLKEPVIRYDLDERFYNREFTQNDFNDRKIWQQLFYENIFEALGYSKNKEMMRKLSEAVDINFLKKLNEKEDTVFYIESALFHVSGLMPDIYNLPDEEFSEYTKELAKCWNEIKGLYDGKTFNSANWHFFKLRPQNFPTIRISGGARLLNKILNENLIGKIIRKVQKIRDFKYLNGALRSFIITKGDGFWKNHYVFDQASEFEIKYFVGISRADDIIVNIILPILSIYFEIFGQKDISKKIVKFYSEHTQNSENYLVKEVSSTLHIDDAWKRSVLHQGMINLYRNYCTKNRCLECKIGMEVFG